MTEDKKGFSLLLVAAVVLGLAGLGSTALWGSEDRWAEIARTMMLKKDFFHPSINGEIYFDKPLLSYWLIAVPALLIGTINEFLVRLPSVLAAIGGLLGTCYLAWRIRGRGAAMVAGWLLLTSLGFLFWARKGAADLENLSAIILAVSWYYHCRDRAGFWSYLLFGLICVLGAHAKGLPAIAVPVVVVLPDLVRHNHWKKHLRWQAFAAVAVCLVVYLLPFVLAASLPLPAGWEYPSTFDALRMPAWAEPYRRELCGLYLVWKENVMRFFEPFDHQEPFYSYFIHVPRILLPWTLLFVFAGVAMVRDYRRLDDDSRWMIEATALIFLLFSASGSRRWYYILPILPFCSVVMALFLCRNEQERWVKWLYQLHRWAVIVAGAGLTLAIPVYWLWRGMVAGSDRVKILRKLATFQDFMISPWWLGALCLCGIAALLPWVIQMRRKTALDCVLGGELRPWAPLMLSVGVLSFGFYCIFPLVLEPYRSEKDFALAVADHLRRTDSEASRLAFFRKTFTKVIFYLKADRPLPVAGSGNENRDRSDEEDGGGLIELATLLRQRPELRYLIVQNRSVAELRAALPSGMTLTPVLEEKVWPWEKPKKKLSMYQISKRGIE